MILTATINEVKRRITFDNPQAVVAVKGDYEVNGVAFAFPAIYEDDFDLSTAVKTVYYKATDGIIYNHVVTDTDTDTGYPLWVFKDEINKGAFGDVEFALVCDKVENGAIVKRWVSMITAFRVQRSIEIDESEQEDNEQTYSERLAYLMTQMANMQVAVNGLASGAPTAVSFASAMTDTSKLYVYTGSESGYTAGHWYYYNGSAWADGGQYGGASVDATLTVSGQAADAKVTGDKIAEIKEDLSNISPLAPVDIYSGSDILGAAANYTGKMGNGVAYTWDEDHSTCTANGTASGTSFHNIYNDKTALPDGIEAGKTYYATCTTTSTFLRLQLLFYDGEGQQLDASQSIEGNRYIVVPSNAVGMIARVRALSGHTFENDVISNMAFYTANDATADIIARLTTYGVCYLRDGVYPVRALDMPENTAIIGCGDASVIRFIDSADGYAIKPTAGCRIENVLLLGGENAPENVSTVSADLGNMHGIYRASTVTQPFYVRSCTILNFNGSGIYAENLGASIRGYMFVSECYIRNCMVGINLAANAEYNTFTAVRITVCNRACINNGGNNTFVGCEFHGVIGFYIDGSQSNSGHGTCSACTFNHIDNTNQSATLGGGDAIKVENLTNGFIFDACQFWYGAINLSNSRGVTVCNSQMGDARQSPRITVTGSYPAFFNNIVFHQVPVISDAGNSKFTACYLDEDGSAVTG